MKSKFSPRARGIAWLCTLVYFASYLMRKNFSVMIAKICEDMGQTEAALSIILVGMTVLYGIGQVINGFLGDRIPPQHMLTAGLLLAALCNIGITLCGDSIILMAVVWSVNGFAHAMLWPPIVRLLSTYLNDEEYSYAAVRVSWGSSFATIFLYLLCPMFLYLITWQQIIFALAIIGIAIAVVWVLFYPKLFKKSDSAAESKIDTADPVPPAEKEKKNIPLPAIVWVPTVLIFVGIVLQGMLRDGLNDWMPSYLSASFNIDTENAILYTVILAVFSIFSFVAANLLHHKFFKNEVTCAGVIFVIAVVASALLYLLREIPVAAVLLMGIIVAAMHGINLMLITVVPKRFLKSGKVSTFSGILNAGTYVGSAIAVPAFAFMADATGNWDITLILSSLVISALGALICFVAVPMWKKFRQTYSDNPNV